MCHTRVFDVREGNDTKVSDAEFVISRIEFTDLLVRGEVPHDYLTRRGLSVKLSFDVTIKG